MRELPLKPSGKLRTTLRYEKSVNIPSLFKEADMNMYTDKALYHQDAET
jgi:hypothetical protein